MRTIALAVVVSALVGLAGHSLLNGGSVSAADRGATASADAAPHPARAPIPTSKRSIVYQWVDERGSVHFADSLDAVPPDWRARAGQIEVDPAPLGRTTPPGASPRRAADVVAAAPARPTHDVTIYTAPWCGWCRKTIAFLDERGIEYVNKDIEADPRHATELKDKTGRTAVPFVEIDGESIRGFDPDAMAALLD